MTSDSTEIFEPDGRAIPVAEEGDGPVAVVLLPARGFGIDSLGTIAHVLEEEGFRTLRIGVRTAQTDGVTLHDLARDVADVLDDRGVKSAYIAGHAFGGALARVVALDHHDHVEGLILLGVAEPGALEGDVAEAMRTAISDAPAADVREATRVLAGDAANLDLAVAHLVRTRDVVAAAVQDAALAATPADEWTPLAPSLAVLVIQAGADPVTPPAAAERLQASEPARVSLARVDGAGHLSPLTHPGETAWEIEDYLAWD
ncbi:alpha/beta hydrolase [Microbacterium sp. 10M-3C3]|jgi:pimeloyl-ACP methyl ester carboxylesterase|uniref:alpha/beta fold hydrolase n=1 Tax=Microbacterium sp. 10M-3C3 TaxID=2483401 RepID=UPI000F62E398|nr:alpha/beta hydrolase [Microbacterium sp. 10M-3C3]